jgi:hypothetical protein
MVRAHFATFGDKLPKALTEELAGWSSGSAKTERLRRQAAAPITVCIFHQALKRA